MYKILFCVLIGISLFSYEVRDKIRPETVAQLKLKRDKIYVIDFFASWCTSCKHELPLIEKLNRQIEHEKIEILGVDVDEDIDKGITFQKEMGVTFQVFNDPRGEIIKAFNPLGMPAVYLIKDSQVKSIFIGAKDEINQVILTALQKIQ